MILINAGAFGAGFWTHNGCAGYGDPCPNFELLREWLEFGDCGLADIRRGLIMNGDGMANAMDDAAPDFLNSTLGVTYVAESYREYNDDWAYCVYLEPAVGGVFEPQAPGIGVYGNGCPRMHDFNVLGVEGGVAGALGNLRFYSYGGTGSAPYVDFAQVVREKTEPGVANWRTAVDGFSLHHLSERGCQGTDCSGDSACVVQAGLHLLVPELLGWMQDPEDPFEVWRYPCEDAAVDDEGETHLAGPVTYLFASRPNPFTRTATIRFSLATAGHARLTIYDVTGRSVRTLVDGELPAGEQTVAWDGTDDAGRSLGAGVFWMQLATHDRYISSKRLLVLK